MKRLQALCCVFILLGWISSIHAFDQEPGQIGQIFYGATQGGFCQFEGFCFSEAEAWQEHEDYYKNNVCGTGCTLQSRVFQYDDPYPGKSTNSIMAGLQDNEQRTADGESYLYWNEYDMYEEVWCQPSGEDPCRYLRTGLVSMYFSYPWGCAGGAELKFSSAHPYNGYYCNTSADKINPDLEKGQVCPNNGSNPVNTFTGNKFQTETDIGINRTRGLGFTRYYNSPKRFSTVFENPQVPTDIGKGWMHNYLYEIEYNPSSGNQPAVYTTVILTRPSGKKLFFQLINNQWENVYESDSPQSTLTQTANGWQLIQPNGDVEDYNTEGRITALTYQQGGSLTFSHALTAAQGGDDNAETLDHVSDHLGNTITFTYNSDQKIQTVTDPNSATYSYAYDSEQNLVSVQNPDASTRQYLYENVDYPNQLTGIIDENNHRYATWLYDSEGRAIQSEHAGSVNQVQLDYTYVNDPIDPRVTVTNEFGKDTTYHYQMIGGVRKVTQVEGHATANCAAANQNYTYDANGFIASKTDWQGNVTTYVNNARGLETSRTEASGTSDARTIATEWHATYRLPIKITEPGKETTFNYDSNGQLLSRTEKESP